MHRELPGGYSAWRRAHLLASWTVVLLGLAHCALGFLTLDEWNPDALWFLGAGLGVLLVGALNLVHIGVEPCRMPTVRFVRLASVLYALFGVAALIAVPEVHVLVLVAALIVQALASRVTLPGPE